MVDPTNNKILNKPDGTAGSEDTPTSTAENLTVAQLRLRAKSLHRAVLARLEIDMLDATPGRIAEMLCPETSLNEVNAIRRRIYDTVVLGRGTHSSASAAALDGGENLPVAARSGVHDVEKVSRDITPFLLVTTLPEAGRF